MAQKTISVGTSGTPVSADTNFSNADDNFDELYDTTDINTNLSQSLIDSRRDASTHEEYDGSTSYTTIPSKTISATGDYFEIELVAKDITSNGKYSILGTFEVSGSNVFGILSGAVWIRDAAGTWHNETITGIPTALPWDSALTIKVVVEADGWHVYVDGSDGGTISTLTGQSLVINSVGKAYGAYFATADIYALKIYTSASETIKGLPLNIYGATSYNVSVKRDDDFSLADSQTNIQAIVISNNIRFFIKGDKPSSNLYLEHTLDRTTYADDAGGTGTTVDNVDVWNLKEVYETAKSSDFNYTRTHTNEPIVAGGSWELAIYENGAADAIGSYSHGDEVLTSTTFLVDGVEKSTTSAADYNCQKLTFIQISELFRANTTTKVADRVCRWDITSQGIMVTQTVDWVVSTTVDTAYLAMLPIRRTYDDTDSGDTITDTAIIGPGYATEDVSLIGHTETVTSDVTVVNIWGSDSGISAEMEIEEEPGLSGNEFYISNLAPYNKLYYSILGTGTSVTSGDSWGFKARYKITTRN